MVQRLDFGRLLASLICFLAASFSNHAATIKLDRVPDEGIQPQVIVDPNGAAHLLFFKGDPKAGDIYYTRRSPAETSWKRPMRVNSVGKVMAVGNIRGAHLALGKNNHPHIAWMGAAQIKTEHGEQHPMLYTRLNPEGTAFEPEHNVITHAYGLDGGGSVAADPNGNVFVAWHGNPPGNKDEEGRAVFLARSTDDGKTFAREEMVSPKGNGSCGCCGMRIHAAGEGKVAILYRNADTKENRAAALLLSQDSGKTFTQAHAENWPINTCPMSSAFLSTAGETLIAGWETAGKVRFGAFDCESGELLKDVTPSEQRKARFPVVAANNDQQALVAWTENMAWMKGGNLAWQLLDSEAKPIEKGNIPGVPVWSFAAVYADPNGNFILLY